MDQPSAIQLLQSEAPQIVIVDLALRRGDGLDLVKWIHANRPATRVIVLTMHPESVYGERAFRAGASGYVDKQDPSRTILEAIRRVRLGKLFFSDSLVDRMMNRAVLNRPTPNPLDLLSDRLPYDPVVVTNQYPAATHAGPMVAGAPNGSNASGSLTVPSACWWFSSRAMIVRPTATAVPFSVLANSGCAPGSGR